MEDDGSSRTARAVCGGGHARAQPFSALCAEYEISRPTGYLWLERYRELGVHGVAEQSRKPPRSPRRTDAALEQQVVLMRRRYPDWGARKLRVLLAREGVTLSRNTVHRILMRHDLVHEEERHTPAERRGLPPQKTQAWLDAYRWEHNHVRPHEARGMQTPATQWCPSPRRYDPQPPRWEYPKDAWVRKVGSEGKSGAPSVGLLKILYTLMITNHRTSP